MSIKLGSLGVEKWKELIDEKWAQASLPVLESTCRVGENSPSLVDTFGIINKCLKRLVGGKKTVNFKFI